MEGNKNKQIKSVKNQKSKEVTKEVNGSSHEQIEDNKKIAENYEDKNMSKSKDRDDEMKNKEDIFELILTEEKDHGFLINFKKEIKDKKIFYLKALNNKCKCA